MNRADRLTRFIAAQVSLSLCCLGLGVLAFTLVPFTMSLFQLPVNIWLSFRPLKKIGFWKLLLTLQMLNALLCLLLMGLIHIFGRDYFMLFLDFDAWSF